MFTDEAAAHRHFSADFFNRTWDLIEKQNRSKEDDERMISLAHASLAHWRLREDCKDRHLSIGCWQISRVHALLGQVENARRYGELCLHVSVKEPPFFLGYAHEALARAAKLAGDNETFQRHFNAARSLAELIEDAADKNMLADDLSRLDQS